MHLHSSGRYIVLNYVTGAYTHFAAHDVSLYRQQYLVYGTSSRHDVRVVRGVIGAGERASGFVILQDASDTEVVAFVEHLKGLPLALRDTHSPGEAVFIVNRGVCRDPACDQSTCTLYHGVLATEDDYQRKNVRTVNTFFELKGSGKLKQLTADKRVRERLKQAAQTAPRQPAPMRRGPALWAPNGRH